MLYPSACHWDGNRSSICPDKTGHQGIPDSADKDSFILLLLLIMLADLFCCCFPYSLIHRVLFCEIVINDIGLGVLANVFGVG